MSAITIRHRTRHSLTAAAAEPSRVAANEPAQELSIAYVSIGSILPAERALRKHSDKKIVSVMGSIRTFGLNAPIIVDADNRIIDGHVVFEAAKRLGIDSIPILKLQHLSADQLRAYRIGVSKLCEGSAWDVAFLQSELLELAPLMALEAIDPEVLGFSTAEFDHLLSLADENPKEPAIVAVAETAVTRPGDVWVLGDHRLCCADALKIESYEALMEFDKARMVFCDPPYNVPVDGHVSGLGKVKHREFAMASGEMSDDEFETFLCRYMQHAVAFSVDGAIHFHCMDWRHISPLIVSGVKAYRQPLKQLIVWNKNNAGMGSFYRSQHEMIAVFKVGTAPHVNTFELGQTGRYRTNVWDYAGANTFRQGRADDLAAHPTVKPVAMVMDAIKDVSRPGDIVLDMFAGSGTTLLAAEKTGRNARCLELDPLYVDVAIRRWEKLTGRQAVLEATGETFTDRIGAADDPPSNTDVFMANREVRHG